MATADVQSAVNVPSHMRSLPGSVNISVAKLPSPTNPTSTVDAAKVAAALESSFNEALSKKDLLGISQLFVSDGYWRDHLALSWQFRTVQSPSKILNFLEGCANSRDGFRLTSISVDNSSPVRAPKTLPGDNDGNTLGVQFIFKAKTVLGTGLGLAHLIEEAGEWKIFTFYTRLEELDGHEQAINEHRPNGAEHGGKPGRKNWAETRTAEENYENGSEPAVMVIGKSKSP